VGWFVDDSQTPGRAESNDPFIDRGNAALERCSGQGFLFARPFDVAATEKFLQTWAENTISVKWPATPADK
jgi:hypothetical protein